MSASDCMYKYLSAIIYKYLDPKKGESWLMLHVSPGQGKGLKRDESQNLKRYSIRKTPQPCACNRWHGDVSLQIDKGKLANKIFLKGFQKQDFRPHFQILHNEANPEASLQISRKGKLAKLLAFSRSWVKCPNVLDFHPSLLSSNFIFGVIKY